MKCSNIKANQKIKIWSFGVICFLLLYFTLPVTTAAEPVFSHDIAHQLNLSTGFETHRTLGDRWELRGIYQLDYDTHYRLQTGLSYNGDTGYINGIFIELGYEKIRDTDYSARLKFLGNQYAQYETASNSIIPYFSWDNSEYYFDLGLNYRFTKFSDAGLWNIFDYNGDVSEVILYYRFGWRPPLKNDQYRIEMEFKNNHEFYAGNLGAYGLFINNSYRVSDRIIIYGNLGLWQSGSIALTATYLKTTLHAGLVVEL